MYGLRQAIIAGATARSSLTFPVSVFTVANDGNIIKLLELLLDKLHDVTVDLVLQVASRLESRRRLLDILVDHIVQLIAMLLHLLQVRSVHGLLLRKARLVTYHEVRAVVECLDIADQILADIEDVLELVGDVGLEGDQVLLLHLESLFALASSLRHHLLEIVHVLHHHLLRRLLRRFRVATACVHLKLLLRIVGLVWSTSFDFASLVVAPGVLAEGLRHIAFLLGVAIRH